jgi:hypothetical protein
MITCFISAASQDDLTHNVEELKRSAVVKKVYAVGKEKSAVANLDGWIVSENFASTKTLKEIAASVDTDFVLLYNKSMPFDLGQFALERFTGICNDSDAGLVYSDYFELKEGIRVAHPVIEYQDGSLRDDFDFGALTFFCADAFKEAVRKMNTDYYFAALYDLRLKVSQEYRLVRVPENLYTVIETDLRKSGEKMFDYVDPKNRQVQIEMEQVCTAHLKDVGAWLAPNFRKIAFDEDSFEYEASVIIPVKNRAKTIGDAINSVLSQKTDFRFNLLIIDNYSNDGTSEIIKLFAEKDSRIEHIIPARKDLGIGGCWNEGIMHPNCGKFVIQLDSDDLYIDDNVISKVVAAFYDQNCAMLVGSYRMVNFKLEEIPPGLIDHKEWTPDNGRNNALRINGLGAPRAFYTPVIRSVKVPNVSYGEDYALGLNISRYYQIGRIYEPLYLCRRWEENSDASLDIQKLNGHNFYKDKIRTLEFWARQQYVKEGQKI